MTGMTNTPSTPSTTNTHARGHVNSPQPKPDASTTISIALENLTTKASNLDNIDNLDEETSVFVTSKHSKFPLQPTPSELAKSTNFTNPTRNPSSDCSPDAPHSRQKPPKKKKKKIPTPQPSLDIAILKSLDPLMARPPSNFFPLLVCSLGNPGSTYANTLHSAGHTVLSEIRTRGLYSPFSKELSGLVSRPNTTRYKLSLTGGYQKDRDVGLVKGEDDFVLWQSTTLMNISGGSVRKAWTAFDKQVHARGLQGRLVVVHDELEASLGEVSIKDGGASPRGHNGLKSCQASLAGVKWWRVGVGIGRPESREVNVVSRYVLSKMDNREQAAVENAAYGVLGALREIQEGKK